MTHKRMNPYKMFTGAMIPNWLLERHELTPISKLVYARAAQYAGKDGKCFPFQRTLAVEIGVSSRSVKRAVKELIDNQLLESERKGMGKPNSYFFLEHP